MFYWLMKKIVAGPWLKLYFRPWTRGLENVPATGGAILASNHLAVIDSFVLPIVLDREIGKEAIPHSPHAVDVPVAGQSAVSGEDDLVGVVRQGGVEHGAHVGRHRSDRRADPEGTAS